MTTKRKAGRPPLPPDQKRIKTSFSLTRRALDNLDRRAGELKCSRSDVVQAIAERIK